MNEANRRLWLKAQEALFALERGLTNEIHDEVKRTRKEDLKLAVDYGGVRAAKAALDTIG